jgi:ABC-2 type transport system permease protein
MNERVRAVIRKEFQEYRRNRLILLTAAILPVVFLAIPAVTVALLPPDAPAEAVTAVVGQAMLFFLIVPVMIPTTIAAYSVIGEREQSTIEPVMTTPVSDHELLLGKAAAATAPAVVMAWVMFVAFLAVAAPLGTEAVREQVFQPGWFVAQALLSPALAVLSIEVGMAVSARSSDIRVAQQVSALTMLPILGGIVVISLGLVDPTPGLLGGAAAVVAVVDRLGWPLLLRMFDRERLLTRWG